MLIFIYIDFRMIIVFERVSTPDTWSKFTEDNIRRSASERAQSDEFMNMADNILKETANDIWNQFNTVNEAFEQRVNETNQAKDKIQNHLSAVIYLKFNKLFKKYFLMFNNFR